jgi:ubiquinone/menaquinone biosynthesis C-methylase UbiE
VTARVRSFQPDIYMMANLETNYRASHLGKGPEYAEFLTTPGYQSYMHAREAAVLRSVLRSLGPIEHALDFACGTGRITGTLQDECGSVIGVDISESMVAQARAAHPRTTFILGDLTRDDLPIQTQQLVTAFRFFGNAESALRREVLTALHRRLVPGGFLILNNHRNPQSIYNRVRKWQSEPAQGTLDYDTLFAELRDTGYRVVRTIGIAPWYVHHRLDAPWVCASTVLRLTELLGRVPGLYRLCPDAILVAERT